MEYSEQYNQCLLKTTSLGRFLFKHFYLPYTQKFFQGNVVDFGCGVGNYLVGLKNRTVLGLDINQFSIDECRKKNIPAILYDEKKDDYNFKVLQYGQFNTMLISHVLEHLENPNVIIKKIFSACAKLNINRVVIKVPGRKGYDWQKEFHVTFIDIDYIKQHELDKNEHYELIYTNYFPIPLKIAGDLFRHNESIFVFQKKK